MGQTNACPSLQQLMGITDSSDPCQSTSTDFTNPNAIIAPGTVVPGGDTYAGSAPITVAQWQAAIASGGGVPTTSANPFASIGTWIQQNQTMVLAGLGVAAVGLFLTSRGRR